MKTFPLVLALSACVADASEEDATTPVESTTTQQLEIAGEHPCLTEPADVSFGSSPAVDGIAFPFNFSFSAGGCKSVIAETTQTIGVTGRLPMLYTFVRFPDESLGTTEADCLRLSSFERAYVKVGDAAAWTFVGETHRHGVWSDGACKQVRGLFEESVNIPAVLASKRTIRIIGSAAYSQHPTLPVILFDRGPLYAEQ